MRQIRDILSSRQRLNSARGVRDRCKNDKRFDFGGF
jgi:hypothetical protein